MLHIEIERKVPDRFLAIEHRARMDVARAVEQHINADKFARERRNRRAIAHVEQARLERCVAEKVEAEFLMAERFRLRADAACDADGEIEHFATDVGR
jgi:hypothetical protein